MPNDPATAVSVARTARHAHEWWRTAHQMHAERIKEKHGLADALVEQRQQSEDAWKIATAQLCRVWIAGRDEERRVTVTKHEPERRWIVRILSD